MSFPDWLTLMQPPSSWNNEKEVKRKISGQGYYGNQSRRQVKVILRFKCIWSRCTCADIFACRYPSPLFCAIYNVSFYLEPLTGSSLQSDCPGNYNPQKSLPSRTLFELPSGHRIWSLHIHKGLVRKCPVLWGSWILHILTLCLSSYGVYHQNYVCPLSWPGELLWGPKSLCRQQFIHIIFSSICVSPSYVSSHWVMIVA